jgi:amino acid transporter
VSAQTIIIIVAVAIVFILAAMQIRGGSRVTEIDRTVRREEGTGDA